MMLIRCVENFFGIKEMVVMECIMCLRALCVNQKNKGGYGLQSIVEKLGPLRSKYALKFIIKPNSLLNRVLKAKYENDLWNVANRASWSSTWKLIQKGSEHLLPIMRWRIVNGIKVDTFKDTWILDKTIKKWPTFVTVLDPEFFHVSVFLSEGAWNREKLKQCFGLSLIELIVSIPIHSDQDEDEIECIQKLSGRTITNLAYEKNFENIGIDESYRWRKKLKLKPKIDILWWRLSKNSIPTYAFLLYRRLAESGGCPRGCMELEDTEHVIFKCYLVKKFIKLLADWHFIIPDFDSLAGCYQVLQNLASSNPFLGNLLCSVVFYCWNSRNKFVHGGKDDTGYTIATRSIIQTVSSFDTCLIRNNWDANKLFKLSKSS
ncbi:hypothetical protein MA16_Dca025739 [Dendrobium catenatum]|uniref:Reverse transcriptase zinc-binding domain-containing protein n=1 Tax=Dendrobium catenatum TaxID=906689 RepID=A0A2I0VE19_9ASPA|nr:hypothetical protein MA16_Dca025739 [Dendrobium catenatum]